MHEKSFLPFIVIHKLHELKFKEKYLIYFNPKNLKHLSTNITLNVQVTH